MIPAWAKYAADDIVSDDDIDEAKSEKTDSRDWLKWALGIGALGAGAYAAYQYSPALREALGNVTLANTAAPSNKFLSWITGGFLPGREHGFIESPAIAGGMAGALPAIRGGPTTFMGGNDRSTQHMHGITQDAMQSAVATQGGRGADPHEVEKANIIRGLLTAPGAHGGELHGAIGTSQRDAQGALARLLNWDFKGKTPQDWNKFTGEQIAENPSGWDLKGYRQAVQQTNRLIPQLTELGGRVGQVVEYDPPAAPVPPAPPGSPAPAAPTPPAKARLRLAEVPEAHLGQLTPENVAHWQAHRQLGKELGLKTDAEFAGFKPEVLAAGLRGGQRTQERTSPAHVAHRAGLGTVIGLGTGAVIDTAMGE